MPLSSWSPDKVVEANFTKYFVIGENEEDQYVYQHGNGLCVIGLLPNHPALRPGDLSITKISFDVGGKDRLQKAATLRGKRKKGGSELGPNGVLCEIEMNNGTVFKIRSCVRGMVIELNEAIASKKEMLLKTPDSEGFIAIIMPSRNKPTKEVTSHLLTESAYNTALQSNERVPTLPAIAEEGGGGGENGTSENREAGAKRSTVEEVDEGMLAMEMLREYATAQKRIVEQGDFLVFGEKRFSLKLPMPMKSRKGKSKAYTLEALWFLLQVGPMTQDQYESQCKQRGCQFIRGEDKRGVLRYLRSEEETAPSLPKNWLEIRQEFLQSQATAATEGESAKHVRVEKAEHGADDE